MHKALENKGFVQVLSTVVHRPRSAGIPPKGNPASKNVQPYIHIPQATLGKCIFFSFTTFAKKSDTQSDTGSISFLFPGGVLLHSRNSLCFSERGCTPGSVRKSIRSFSPLPLGPFGGEQHACPPLHGAGQVALGVVPRRHDLGDPAGQTPVRRARCLPRGGHLPGRGGASCPRTAARTAQLTGFGRCHGGNSGSERTGRTRRERVRRSGALGARWPHRLAAIWSPRNGARRRHMHSAPQSPRRGYWSLGSQGM